MIKFATVAQFVLYFHNVGLKHGEDYAFVSRLHANAAERYVKENSMWQVEFIGPQQFIVR